MSAPEVPWDVFISHRGKDAERGSDTKWGFVSFLHSRLAREGVRTFMDERELHPGAACQDAWSNMLAALRKCRIALPVLHESYGSSKWCLHELACMVTAKRVIMPVFLSKEGTDVLHALRNGAESLRAQVKRVEADEWLAAIGAVGKATGWRLDQYDGFQDVLVDAIVRDVLTELGRPQLHVAMHPVGMNDRVSPVLAALEQHQAVGLYGMGGIGKTTVAKAVYNHLYPGLSGRGCFLEVGRKADSARLQQLQAQTLRDLCEIKGDIGAVDQGCASLEERLRHSRALLVIDDVWEMEHLRALLVPMGPGSRIIVTTRKSDLLNTPLLHVLPELGQLGIDQSLELFSWHAFKCASPPPGLEELADSVVEACGGLPLTLEVVGSFLYGPDIRERWSDAISSLQHGEAVDGSAEDRLFARLRLSYDDLAPRLQDMFLDAACFFSGSPVGAALAAWGDRARMRLDILVRRCLLQTHDSDDEGPLLRVHDQLQEMARHIVGQESSIPSQRSRTWMPESQRILTSSQALDSLQALSCLGCPAGSAAVLPPMTRLRLLNLGSVSLLDMSSLGRYDSLSYLEWHAAASNADLPSSLAVLDISRSKLRVLPESMSMLRGLQRLDLRECRSLCELPEGIRELTGLTMLRLTYVNLESLPQSIGALTTLQSLELQGCSQLTQLPVGISALGSLQALKLSKCESLEKLSAGISALTALQVLDMEDCRSLSQLPTGISTLTQLRSLLLSDCERLEGLPTGISVLTGLQVLELGNCKALSQLPPAIGALTGLAKLNCAGCRQLTCLPDSISRLTRLKVLDVHGCFQLKQLPPDVSTLTGLEVLDCGACSLSQLPAGLSALTGLRAVDVSNCCNLTELPLDLTALTGITRLDLSNCGSFDELLVGIGALTGLQRLCLKGWKYIEQLPEGLSGLTALTLLQLSGCIGLTKLPAGIAMCTALAHLYLGSCGSISELPQDISTLKGLRELDLTGCKKLVRVPSGISALTGLTRLSVADCSSLSRLPNAIGGLTELRALDLSHCKSLAELHVSICALLGLQALPLQGCNKLKELPASINAMTRLTELALSECSSLSVLSDGVSSLTSLRRLLLRRCSSLKELPAGISALTRLLEVNCYGCSRLAQLPEGISNLGELTRLSLEGCSGLAQLPPGVSKLTGLQKLECAGCSGLVELHLGISALTRLTELDVGGCNSLKRLPAGIAALTLMAKLQLSNCSSLLELPAGITALSSLQDLDLRGCRASCCNTLDLTQLPAGIRLHADPQATAAPAPAIATVIPPPTWHDRVYRARYWIWGLYLLALCVLHHQPYEREALAPACILESHKQS